MRRPVSGPHSRPYHVSRGQPFVARGIPYHAFMAAITIQGVTKQFGTQVVLENVTLELHPREVAGLVGANGAGKTTLFKVIAGEEVPDMGTATTSRGLDVGYLRQEPEISLDRTLREEVGSVFAELLALEERLHKVADEMAAKAHDPNLAELMETYDRINSRFLAAGGHTFETRLNEILGGLGFSQADHVLPMSSLSGGQKCRAALAKLLLADRRYLLLDEPTNHLDIDAVRWLEKFLAGHHGGAVIISHDRYLLDRLCDRVIELDRRRVYSFPGNYTNYAQTREIRILTQQRQYEKDQEFIEKERAFIDKHLSGQRTKEAQGRRTRLERRLKAGEFVTEAPQARLTSRFKFTPSDREMTTVLRCDELGMRYGDNVLFTDLSFQVRTGDRFGITGPNGTGKTTLLKIIRGEVKAVSGEFTLDPKFRVGYYAQEGALVDPNRTVLDEVRAARDGFGEQAARDYIARFMFTGDSVFKPLGLLSGGEQSRVRLATLILTEPDLLILDEPTNHLDIPTCETLEESLAAYPGTIITVSHDRYFLDRIVGRLLVIRREGHTVCAGNYSDYIAQVEQDRAATAAPAPASPKKPKESRPEPTRPAVNTSKYDRLSVDEIELIVIDKEAELAALQERFADPAVLRDPIAREDLEDKIAEVEEELAIVDAAWQERADSE